MTNVTKAMNATLAAALAASSFTALAVTASAAGEISLDGDKTFDAVRITYTAATDADATLTVDGTNYAIPAGTTSIVVNVAEDTTASEIGLTNYNQSTTEIKLLDYEKINMNTTATAPYLAAAYNGGDGATTVNMGNVANAGGRYANCFDGDTTTSNAWYRPNQDGTNQRAENGWYAANFDLGSDTEIAKVRLYLGYSQTLTSGYKIGAINDLSATSAETVFASVPKSDLQIAPTGKAVNVETNKRKYIDTDINATADKLQLKFDEYVDDSGASIMVSIFEIELYTYADVYTVEKQTITYASEAVDLGKAVTFNKLTANESANWETSTDGNTWTAYTDGAETTAQYIRTTSEESTPTVPAFTLSWEGNLAKYAGEGYNGASIGGANHGGSDLSLLYDGNKDYNDANSKDESVLIYPNYSVHNIRFNINAPASVASVQAYWVSGGVMYPHTYKIETSNKGTVWNTTDLTISEKNEANKKAYTDGIHELNVTAAIVNIDYTESYRIADGRSGDIVRTTEIEIPGTVSVASYDGTEVTFPVIPDDEQIVEPKAEFTAVAGDAIVSNDEEVTDDSVATGFVATVTNTGDAEGSFTTVKWAVTSNEQTGNAVQTVPSITLAQNAEAQVGLIITGLQDAAATAAVTVE